MSLLGGAARSPAALRTVSVDLVGTHEWIPFWHAPDSAQSSNARQVFPKPPPQPTTRWMFSVTSPATAHQGDRENWCRFETQACSARHPSPLRPDPPQCLRLCQRPAMRRLRSTDDVSSCSSQHTRCAVRTGTSPHVAEVITKGGFAPHDDRTGSAHPSDKSPPNTGDKLRASNMLNARQLHPLVVRLGASGVSSSTAPAQCADGSGSIQFVCLWRHTRSRRSGLQ